MADFSFGGRTSCPLERENANNRASLMFRAERAARRLADRMSRPVSLKRNSKQDHTPPGADLTSLSTQNARTIVRVFALKRTGCPPSKEKSAMPAAPDLPKIVSRLAAHYGHPGPPITTDPFELVLLGKRRIFDQSKTARRSLSSCFANMPAPNSRDSRGSARETFAGNESGGMHPEQRVNRLREIA